VTLAHGVCASWLAAGDAVEQSATLHEHECGAAAVYNGADPLDAAVMALARGLVYFLVGREPMAALQTWVGAFTVLAECRRFDDLATAGRPDFATHTSSRTWCHAYFVTCTSSRALRHPHFFTHNLSLALCHLRFNSRISVLGRLAH
jgi:hypothetical protein